MCGRRSAPWWTGDYGGTSALCAPISDPAASPLDDPLGIPCHFPKVPVGVLKVARVAAPERVVRRLDHDCARLFCLFHYRVDLDFRGDVVPESEIGRARAAEGDPGVVSNALSRPKR